MLDRFLALGRLSGRQRNRFFRSPDRTAARPMASGRIATRRLADGWRQYGEWHLTKLPVCPIA